MMKKQLYVLPFAGGNVYSFNFLKPLFPSTIEVVVLELPGRGKRMAEKLLTTKEAVIDDYVRQICQSRRDVPYVLYGHSMGALMGLAVSSKMESLGDAPGQLIVSGNAGPGTGENKMRYLMNDMQFKEELMELGGVPSEVLDTPELFDFFAPIMRCDFEVIEKNPMAPGSIQLQIPVMAIMGNEEKTVGEIENWRNYTSAGCVCKVVNGHHFFIHQQADFMAQILIESLNGNLVHES